MKNNTKTNEKRGPPPCPHCRGSFVLTYNWKSPSLKHKMNLIPVYVAVGAISFVKCEIGHNSVAPLQSWQWSQIDSGEQNAKQHKETNVKEKAEIEVPESNDIFEGFRQLKNIYLECKAKINRRLKKILKTRVKSRVPELKTYFLSLYQCVKVLSFKSLDEMLQEKFIPVTDQLFFVKDETNVTEDFSSGRTATSVRPVSLKEYSTFVIGRGWTDLALERLEYLLRTHSLKFYFDKSFLPQGRARRREHRMFAFLVMGFMIMASILIPMGFQFLTVLGGKSLLLAKMALIMSAINGLKKIATSNVGYGLYHTGTDGHHHEHLHHGFHEKYYNLSPQNYNNMQGYN